MIPIADLPDVLPVFPLPGALLLPRSRLPMQLFEPRYLAMFDDVLKTPHRLIGMVQPYAHPDDSSRLHAIGCAGRITSFSETGDGRYMITLTGVSRFAITQEIEGFTPYRRCNVEWAGFERDLGTAEKDPAFDRAPFLKMLGRFFADKGLSTDWDSLGDADDELLINSLAMLCPFGPEDKQALLEASSLTIRRETLTTLIQFALRGGSADEALQ